MVVVQKEGFRRPLSTACSCGSGFSSYWAKDARGIELCRVCKRCRVAKLRVYRPEIFINPNYQADEQIEPD